MTEHVNQRSLTVGMTRHTAEYGMFYSREAVGSYDDLVTVGLRPRTKELASDYRELKRDIIRDVPTRWLSLEATRRELEPIAQGWVSEYSRDERKAAFSVLNAIELLEREAPHHQLRVPKDWHHSLRDPGTLKVQIAEAREGAVDEARAQIVERIQNLERKQAQRVEPDRDRGRGTGRGR